MDAASERKTQPRPARLGQTAFVLGVLALCAWILALPSPLVSASWIRTWLIPVALGVPAIATGLVAVALGRQRPLALYGILLGAVPCSMIGVMWYLLAHTH